MPDVREHTIEFRGRALGLLGAKASSLTLAWLASHRGRLCTFLLGGRRLSLLVVWDRRGAEYVDRSEADEEAIRQLVYGSIEDQVAELRRRGLLSGGRDG